MTELPEAAPAIELTPDEVEELPLRLREQLHIEAHGRRGNRQRLQRWVLFGAHSKQDAAVMRQAATMAGRILGQRRKRLTERNIETLVDLYLQGEERADVNRDLEQDNAELRTQYLREVPTFTAADIHEFMNGARLSNPSEPASRWRREGRVFAVRNGRTQLFPCFQFTDGRPRPAIRQVLRRLPADMTPWQTAFWFRSGNGWLDGRSPEEVLDDEDSVLAAADRLCDSVVG